MAIHQFKFQVLYYRPLIIISQDYGALESLLTELRDVDLLLFVICSWHFRSPKYLNRALYIQALARTARSQKVLNLANTPSDLAILNFHGIPAIHCSQNCFLDENIFKPIPEVATLYDAIYDAQLIPFKRHMLAHQVDNLALVTYVKPFKRHYQYEREVFNGLKNATWLNGPFSDCPAFLPATHVNVLLNRARCGLILSAEEGANYASTQYLLAGLPVITTASIGGREAFFDERYTFHVDSDSASVVQSVRRANQQLFDRQAIRNSALLIIERHRAVLGSYIEQMLKDYHIFINWKIVWKSAFINKMAVPQSLEAVRALAASCL